MDGRGNLTIINYDQRGNRRLGVGCNFQRSSNGTAVQRSSLSGRSIHQRNCLLPIINGDGFVDVISESGTFGDSVSVQLGNGAGGFGISNDLTAVFDPVSLHVADVNNDGRPRCCHDQRQLIKFPCCWATAMERCKMQCTFASGVSPYKELMRRILIVMVLSTLVTTDATEAIPFLCCWAMERGQFNSFNSFAVAQIRHARSRSAILIMIMFSISIVGNDGAINQWLLQS